MLVEDTERKAAQQVTPGIVLRDSSHNPSTGFKVEKTRLCFLAWPDRMLFDPGWLCSHVNTGMAKQVGLLVYNALEGQSKPQNMRVSNNTVSLLISDLDRSIQNPKIFTFIR